MDDHPFCCPAPRRQDRLTRYPARWRAVRDAQGFAHARGWILEAGGDHLLTNAGYATIGQQRPSPPRTIDDSPARDIVQPGRPGTKLAKVVARFQNPDGATLFQLTCCTGWQPHTIRGALSGMVGKKLGLNVVSTQATGGERVDRIT